MKRSLPSSFGCPLSKISCNNNNNILTMEHYKIFNDSVHGHMKVHPLCVQIIDTPQFQRLRYIKQLSTSYWVYPGACHNRFEHSLGVSYLAGCMVDALVQNTPNLVITPEEKLSVEIAGLCHDLGHGPWSHTWERFVRRFGHTWKHEKGSEEMLEYLIEDNNLAPLFDEYNLNLELIKELIRGGGTSLPTDKRYLYQIIANKTTDIDVDKWDYFLRDGHQLNLKITFDYRRMLAFCVVIQGGPGLDGPQIAFRNKEASNIFDMFRVRADLHLRAYQHAAVKSTELLLVDALVAANDFFHVEVDGEKYKLSECHKNVKAMVQITDHILNVIQYSKDPNLDRAQALIQRLMKRQLYTLLGEFNFDENKDKVPHYQNELNQAFAPLDLVLDLVDINMGSSGDPLSRVVFYKKPVNSKIERDDQVRYDKVYRAFPFEISKNPCHKEMRVFCKSQDIDPEQKTKILKQIENWFGPAIENF